MLFGKKTKLTAENLIPSQPPEQPKEKIEEPVMEQEKPAEPQETKDVPSAPEVPENDVPEEEDQAMRESDLTASISRETVINGDIVSEDNIDIFGAVEGSIKCSAVVKVYGTVNGNINCSVLVANGASITGDIESESSVVLGNDTTVKGDIRTGVMNISGQVNGNVTASESAAVSSCGSVYGDISTPVIEVSKGAVVFGSVVMEQPKEKPSKKQSETGRSAPKEKTTVTELTFSEPDKKKTAE